MSDKEEKNLLIRCQNCNSLRLKGEPTPYEPVYRCKDCGELTFPECRSFFLIARHTRAEWAGIFTLFSIGMIVVAVCFFFATG